MVVVVVLFYGSVRIITSFDPVHRKKAITKLTLFIPFIYISSTLFMP